MKKSILTLSLVTSILAAGCGSSVCDKADEASKACKSNPDAELTNKSDCESSLDKCTDDDQKKMEAYFDCVIDADCAGDSVLSCLAKFEGMSQECIDAN